MRPRPAPSDALESLEEASAGDLTVARLTLGLFGTIMGCERPALFPGYRGGLLEWRQFPSELQEDVCILISWALYPSNVELNGLYAWSHRIEVNARRMRSHSDLGKKFRRNAKRLMRLNPPPSDGEWSPSVVTYHFMKEEFGKPLTERVVLRPAAFKPRIFQIVPHGVYMNATWTPGALTVRLNDDGYTVEDITLAIEVDKQFEDTDLRRFEGELVDFFETGTEGAIWMLEDDRRFGREALKSICEGDHLTIQGQFGKVLWKGVIKCDKKVGWRP